MRLLSCEILRFKNPESRDQTGEYISDNTACGADSSKMIYMKTLQERAPHLVHLVNPVRKLNQLPIV